ncbi:MAG: YggS family pyridoxal phosphate-dependent enzyme [Sandaracinaceae bacterium]
MSEIASRLEAVRERIARATARAGRPDGSVTLVAVSKTKPPGAIREAYAQGARVFGENYVQELADKRRALADLPDLELHFIGHLQRNKVKDVLAARALVETVDSPRLAEELGKRASALGVTVPVLIQVNVAREPQKSGCDPDELATLIAKVRAWPALTLRGLMTIPPLGEDPERSRPHFRALRELAHAQLGEGAWLSMGMSADLEVAIEEGATHVRVGTAIFGERSVPG